MWAVMAADPAHLFQCLSKRQGIMRSELSRLTPDLLACGLERLEVLAGKGRRLTPARRRIVGGIEAAREGTLPLPNDMLGVSAEDRHWWKIRVPVLRQIPAGARFVSVEPYLNELGPVDLTGIHWVICGGESGRTRRPMDLDWVRDLRDQCAEQGVAFWFKLLCTNSRKRQPAAQQFLISASDRAQNGRSTYSAAGKRIPKSRSMVCRKRELDVAALFRGSAVRSDREVEHDLPASSTADRKHPGDEPRLAINGRARPGLMDGQNLVVHARKPGNRAGKAAA